MTGDLVAWLREQILEIEQVALAVPLDMRTREWSHPGRWLMDGDPGGDQSNAIALIQHGGRIGELVTEHIATHSPRDALAQCEAHTRILDEVVPLVDGMDDVMEQEWGHGSTGPHQASERLVKLMALAYQRRPGYQEEWRP